MDCIDLPISIIQNGVRVAARTSQLNENSQLSWGRKWDNRKERGRENFESLHGSTVFDKSISILDYALTRARKTNQNTSIILRLHWWFRDTE